MKNKALLFGVFAKACKNLIGRLLYLASIDFCFAKPLKNPAPSKSYALGFEVKNLR